MSGFLYRLGRFSVRHRRLVLSLWVFGVLGLLAAGNVLGAGFADDFRVPGTESQQALDVLKERFPEASGTQATIVFRSSDIEDDAAAETIDSVLESVEGLPNVEGVESPNAEHSLGGADVSDDGRTAFATVHYDSSATDLGEPAVARLDDAVEPAREAGMRVELGGPLIESGTRSEPEGSEAAGMVAAIVVLLFAFGSVVAMGLPIGTALLGLAGGMAIVRLVSVFVDLPSVAPILATMIGLGVGIDYALFIVTRHRESLAEGRGVEDAAGRAIATSGQAVLFAGGTVVIAILGLWISGIPFVGLLGTASAIIVSLAVLAALTLLPALLGFAGGSIDRLRVPGLRTRTGEDGHGGWERFGRHVAGMPWRHLILSLVVLGLLAAPLFSMRLGQADAGTASPSKTQRRAYDMMTEAFGAGYNGPLLLTVELDSPAEPGEDFLAERDRAHEIRRKLKGVAAYGERVEARMTSKGGRLQERGLGLAEQGASLQVMQQDLERQGARLLVRKEALERKGAILLSKKDALVRKGALLQQRGEVLGGRLQANLAKQATVTELLNNAVDPQEIADLQARLQNLKERQAAIASRLAGVQAAGERLQAQGERLAAKGAQLEATGADLARDAAALQARGADLASMSEPFLAQKSSLEQAGASLQREAKRTKAHGKVMKARAKSWMRAAKDLEAALKDRMMDAAGEEEGTDPRLTTLRDELASVPGIDSVSPVRLADDGRTAVITAIPVSSPQSETTTDLVHNLRDEVLPGIGQREGSRVYVGGQTATYIDLADKVFHALPLFITAVLVMSFVLLMLVFRSIWVPLKAVLLNLLSIGAAYGVVVAVFQWGWAKDLVGIEETIPIVSFVPMMMFAILFGLSMDYEVFLLSRIREEYVRTGDNEESVIRGIATTARVITSAALIMIAVFLSFLTNEDPTVKMVGLGLATAVAIDATIVRVILVPATMVLLGKGNWWLPGWLDRILPRIDIEGEPGANGPVAGNGHFHGAHRPRSHNPAAT